MKVCNTRTMTGVASMVGMMAAKLDSIPSTRQKVYQQMFEHLGMGDHTAVANLIDTKVGNNQKCWP